MPWSRLALLLAAGGLSASLAVASPETDAPAAPHPVPPAAAVADAQDGTAPDGAAEPTAYDAVPVAVPGPGAQREALYRFVLAKVLSGEGDLGAAGSAFQEALALEPDEPYLRLEYASHLIQLAGAARGGRREALLQEARRQAEQARDLVLARDDDEPAVWSTLAEVYYDLARNDPALRDDAREAMERVVEADPDDLESSLTLGQLYLSDGQAEKAVALFERVAQRTSGNRFVYSLLGEALMRTGRTAEAEDVLGRLLALDPSSRQVRLGLATLLSERGAHEAALEVLEESPPGLRAQPEVQRRMALELFAAGRLEEARERLDALHAAEPEDPQAMAARALVLAAQGSWDEMERMVEGLDAVDDRRRELAALLQEEGEAAAAERLLRNTLEALEPAEPGTDRARTAAAVRFQLADLLRSRGEPGAAADLVEPVVVAVEPEQRRSLLISWLDLLDRAGRTGEALARLEEQDRALRTDPALRALRAELLLSAGREEEARRILERLAEDPETLLLAARAAQGAQRYDLALPYLEEVAARPEPPLDALFMLGAAYERTGHRERAAEAFRRVLERDPRHHPSLNYLGYMWAERGENLEEALELIRRAVNVEPDVGSYLDSLGWVHYQLGDYRLALHYLQRAARLEPREPEIHEHLGDVHAALGDPEAARRAYRRALELAGTADAEQVADLERKLEDLQLPGADGP